MQAEDKVVENKEAMCRICLVMESIENNMISPCGCKGTMKYVHKGCLKTWRYRDKKIEEIKKCEQCLMPYSLDDEIVPHNLLVKLTSLLILSFVLVFTHFMINLFFETIAIISLDLSQNDMYYSFYRNDYNYEELQKRFMLPMPTPNPIKIGLEGTIITIAFVYQVLERKNIFYVLNYIFTCWRLIRFGFVFDRIFLFGMNCHEFYHLIKCLNRFTDSVLMFILNYS